MTRSILDTDLYKLTMMAFTFKYYPDIDIKYELINRDSSHNIYERIGDDGVRRLRDIFTECLVLLPTEDELDYLKSLKYFSHSFLNFFATLKPDKPVVEVVDGELKISVSGNWTNNMLWEIIIMSSVNELYYENSFNNMYDILGKTHVDWKGYHIKQYEYYELPILLKAIEQNNFKFMEFGTRRRYSKEVQDIMLNGLFKYFGDKKNFLGTSNVKKAMEYNSTPKGSMAHELFMTISTLHNCRKGFIDSQKIMMDQWDELYDGKFNLALTDTYTTDFFYKEIFPGYLHWDGVRQDSGCSKEFLVKTAKFYAQHGVPTEIKTVVFSDGLNIDSIIELNEFSSYFFKTLFGWGTYLSNPFFSNPPIMVSKAVGNITTGTNPDALPIVVKLVEANGVSTGKLSDTPGKTMGSSERIAQIKEWIS